MDGNHIVKHIESLIRGLGQDLEGLRKDYNEIRQAHIGLSHLAADASALAARHTTAIELQAEVMADIRRRIAALEDAPRVKAMVSGELIPPEQDDACVTMKLSLNELKIILRWGRGVYGLTPGSEPETELAERLRNAIAVLSVR